MDCIQSRVYFHLTLIIPRIGSRSIGTLTRIKQLLKMNEHISSSIMCCLCMYRLLVPEGCKLLALMDADIFDILLKERRVKLIQ